MPAKEPLPEKEIDPFTTLAISPNGLIVASGFSSGKISLWDLGTEKTLLEFKGHKGAITNLLFSPDSKQLYSSSTDKLISIWDPFTSKKIKSFDTHKGTITSLAINSSGTLLASGSADLTINLWDITHNWKKHKEFRKHRKEIVRLVFTPIDEQLISCSKDHLILIWDLSSGKLFKELKAHFGAVESIQLVSEGRSLLSGSDDGVVNQWDLLNYTSKQIFVENSGITNIALHPKKQLFVCGHNNGTITLWDLENGRKIKSWREHSQRILTLLFSPQGEELISLSSDNSIKVWKMEKVLQEKQKNLFTTIKTSFVGSEFGKIVKGLFAKPTVQNQQVVEQNQEKIYMKIIEELPELVFSLQDGEKIHVNDIKGRYQAQQATIEKAILMLLKEEKIIGQFNPFSGILVINRKAINSENNDDINPEPRRDCPQTCFYCGAPIDTEINTCPYCENDLARCPICKLNINFEDNVGVCVYCGTKGHLTHMKESIKVFGYCPNCQRQLNWEAEVIPFVREAKK